MSDESNLLLPFESYEENAVNIGTQQKSADMARFIERVREDGLYLLNVNMTDSRIRSIAQFLNKYDAGRIMVVSARQYGQRPARLLSAEQLRPVSASPWLEIPTGDHPGSRA